jgi:hypothetical protein
MGRMNAVVISKETEQFLEQLDRISKDSLVHRSDIGIILELTHSHNLKTQLAELAFGAKFCWNTYSTMSLLKVLLGHSTDDICTHFKNKFFSVTEASLQTQIELLHDISWIKNWSIDHKMDALT